MNHWYGKARSAKNTSGQHLNFDCFVNWKGWLIFYHHKLEEIGDTDIMNATYATLPPDVFAMSGDSTSISDALTPNKSARGGGRKEKEAKEAEMLNKMKMEAANAIVQKNNAERTIVQTDQFEALEDQIYDHREQLVEICKSIINADGTQLVDGLKRKKTHVKRKLARAVKKQSELKKILCIESDINSDSSDSDIYS